MMGGFSGGAALAKKIVPKPPRGEQANQTPSLNQVSPAPIFPTSATPSIGGNLFTVSKPYSYNPYPLSRVNLK
jgi:hypothetical protein